MLKLIVALIAVPLAGILIAAALKPDSFRVQRSTRIDAAPETVFALINDLHQFNRWNPYERKDPAIKGRYSGPASGVGATHAWESAKVGTGSMEISSSSPSSKVEMKLEFIKPFKASNQVEFAMTPTATATEVSWTMSGAMPFISKVMSVFVSMDKMIGKDFEDGLANLKTIAEQPAGATESSRTESPQNTPKHNEEQS
ncbi:SRPBCC family protein [Nevskia ramosa]|uniref:SRPBCC family protein n=1 Tax=Nevskia ramosa TaxID=64002 RepID=UPI0003B78A1F|nr:SRPBCC family protein [Nevskia ramosa]